jgi:hypothetical protein
LNNSFTESQFKSTLKSIGEFECTLGIIGFNEGGLEISLPKSISSGARYVICIVKLDEENPTYAGLAQENGFGST